MGVKDSTKDIDLMVPDERQHDYLIKTLEEIGYKSVSGHGWVGERGFIFDIFRGKRIHTTELLESPLEPNNHEVVKEFASITLSVLNAYDLITSKLFRGSAVDLDDCLVLWRAQRSRIDLDVLKTRFRQTAAYDIGEEKVLKHLDHFLSLLEKEVGHGI